ncbi:3-dehydroquinate synthase [Natranaerovirga hydrolytica]|uniref:3-dehydroquinate synthase n=1 Tax=Natranaerovirga hydrolytica TaxID=680378 RepID=A0A4R1MXV9_9FIRM|nr:3-dehydroquinate synthase [Natranaerovirga hydrolytica]TCK98107.1 3-dehydroquinate synthase [Natranaerovirga hydrolytica]
MSRELFIQTKENHYPIKFCQSYDDLIHLLDPIQLENKKVCIVTDTNVEKFYLEEINHLMSKHTKKTIAFVFEAGEKSKNLETVNALYQRLIDEQFDRDSILVALGGGVVGDLTGFAAATFLRGIDFIQLPTTLLSQVDSSIGGKTGVDFQGYKNMIGAFYQPRAVIINTQTINTLPKREFYSGMSEIIKHSFIKNKDYLEWLEQNHKDINALNQDVLTEMIYKSGCIKKGVVEKDAKENNIRALLNFGHTVGHAIEKLKDFSLLHGECVAIGMVVAAHISCERGYITTTDLNRIIKAIELFNLPTKVEDINKDEVILATKSDKKVKSSVLSFILLDAIGEGSIYKDIEDNEMEKALEYVMN